MPDSRDNIRFQVLVNGESRAIGGMTSNGVLGVILDWVRCDPAAVPPHVRKDPDVREHEWIGKEVHIQFGGLDSATNEHVDWFDDDLKVGDEVVVRVLPPGEFDLPVHRYSARKRGKRARKVNRTKPGK